MRGRTRWNPCNREERLRRQGIGLLRPRCAEELQEAGRIGLLCWLRLLLKEVQLFTQRGTGFRGQLKTSFGGRGMRCLAHFVPFFQVITFAPPPPSPVG